MKKDQMNDYEEDGYENGFEDNLLSIKRYVFFVVLLVVFLVFKFLVTDPRYQQRDGPVRYLTDWTQEHPGGGAIVIGALLFYLLHHTLGAWREGKIPSRYLWGGYVRRQYNPINFYLMIMIHIVFCFMIGGGFFYLLWKCIEPFLK